SLESAEILYIDNHLWSAEFFAITVTANLADKLTNSGMPILKQGDLLIFIKQGDPSTNSIILAKYNETTLILGIIMEVEDKYLWIKSVDIPQKQVVLKIKRDHILGIVHNVQFSK